MHLIATNICVWLRVIVLETLTSGLAARLLHSPAGDATTTSATSAIVNVSPISYYHLVARDDVTGSRIQVDRIGQHGSRQLNVSGKQPWRKLRQVKPCNSGMGKSQWTQGPIDGISDERLHSEFPMKSMKVYAYRASRNGVGDKSKGDEHINTWCCDCINCAVFLKVSVFSEKRHSHAYARSKCTERPPTSVKT